MMKEINMDPIVKDLTGFIKKAVHGAGFKRVILGLSGGVDSATVAHLSKEALGSENVVAVLMPYGDIDPKSIECADLVIDALKIKKYKVDIAPMVDAYFKNFPDADELRRGNKMARERMAVLYDLSKKESALVIGSGNRTEGLLGYCTLYGDSAWALNPLACLYKTRVYMLARHLGVPEPVIKRRPTAGLWSGQADEDELGYSYSDIDRLLPLMVDEGFSDEKLQREGFDKKFISDIKDRIKKSEFKRKPALIPGDVS